MNIFDPKEMKTASQVGPNMVQSHSLKIKVEMGMAAATTSMIFFPGIRGTWCF